MRWVQKADGDYQTVDGRYRVLANGTGFLVWKRNGHYLDYSLLTDIFFPSILLAQSYVSYVTGRPAGAYLRWKESMAAA